MKNKKLAALASLLIASVLLLSACAAAIPANAVFSLDDLPGKKIGVQQGTTGAIYAEDYTELGSTVEQYTKTTDAIQALKQGKIDCVILDNAPAQVYVSQNSDLTLLSDPFAVEDYAICLSKENAELGGAINDALAALKADGTITSILANYIGDAAGQTPYVSSNADFSGGKLVMATEATFPPYEYYEGEKVVGIDVDIAQAVADLLKMELTVEEMAFDSIIPAVQSGKADIGAAGMTVSPDRLLEVDFTDSYATGTQVVIVRAK
ncbi:MAG: transporter substrate-binding domain-containing protein [Clostridiaceae bacterium]|nr:transporter substrate-binding domain-containing protein [Eubacteriales bacterium]